MGASPELACPNGQRFIPPLDLDDFPDPLSNAIKTELETDAGFRKIT